MADTNHTPRDSGTQPGSQTKPTKDDLDLVAAALGLRAPAIAQAEVHLIDCNQDAETAAEQQALWDTLTDTSGEGGA